MKKSSQARTDYKFQTGNIEEEKINRTVILRDAMDINDLEHEPSEGPRLDKDPDHARECHARWLARANRPGFPAIYKDEKFCHQCGACRFFVRLTGRLITDWGACTNESSPMDGKATFEHDGCDFFSRADEDWDY